MYNSPIAVLKGIKADFSKQLGQMDGPKFKPFVHSVSSDSNNEDYRFLDAMPYIKEWTSKRTHGDFKDYKYQIDNKHWEISIDVNRDTLDDSKKSLGGNIEKDVRAAAGSWNTFGDRLVNDLITANGTAYDASTFFATSHNIDGTTAIDNLKSGTQTGTYTLAELEADLATARTAMYSYKDRNDMPINDNPRWLVLCASDLYDKFLTLRNSQDVYISGTKTNIYKDSFEIVINNWQSTANYDWYLINTNATILPFIYQERQGVQWNVKDDPEDIYIKYLMDARMNAGYGAFTSICKINN